MSDAPAYAESLYPQREFGWAPLHAWRTARHKLIEAPRPSSTTSRRTPARRTTARRRRPRASPRCGRSCRRRSRARPPRPRPAVDPETAERLRALGYVGGGARRRPARGRPLGATPRTASRLVPRLNRGMSVARTEPAQAIRELTRVLAEDPGLLVARRTRAVAYATAGQYAAGDPRAAAAREGRRASRAEDAVVLGDNLRFAGPPRRGARRRSSGPRARTRSSPSPGSRSPRSASRRSSCAEAARPTRRSLADRPRPRGGAARPRRPRPHAQAT